MNSHTHDSVPVITITNRHGTTSYQPKTEEEYKVYLREKDENQQKTANAVGLLVYATIILSCISVYTIYSFI